MDLGEEGEKQFRYLRAAVELGDGFELLFAVSPNQYALDEVENRLLTGAPPDHKSLQLAYGPDNSNQITTDLLEQASGPEPRRIISIRCNGAVDEAQAGWTRALILLNEQRNLIVQRCPHALILIGPDWLVPMAGRVSPDLWSIRTFVATFPDLAAQSYSASPFQHSDRWPLAYELESGQYYSDLADNLAGSPSTIEQAMRARLLLKAADSWLQSGDTEMARNAAERAIHASACSRDEGLKASATARIARVLLAQGDPDEALRTLREDVAPVFEKLAYDAEAATAASEVAHCLWKRGQSDDAREIMLTKVIPVYQRTGDARSLAVAWFNVADLMAAGGDLAGALSIIRTDVMPAFEQLEDVHSLVLAQARAADLHMAQGWLRDALKLQKSVVSLVEKLDDPRARAVANAKYADMLMALGNHKESLHVYRDRVLPILAQIGDIRALVEARMKLAAALLERKDQEAWDEAHRVLTDALDDALRLEMPESLQIDDLLRQIDTSGIPAAPQYGNTVAQQLKKGPSRA